MIWFSSNSIFFLVTIQFKLILLNLYVYLFERFKILLLNVTILHTYFIFMIVFYSGFV